MNLSTEAVRPDAPASLLGLALPSSAGSPYVRIGFHWPVANRGRETHSHGLQRRCVTDAVSCHGGNVAITCEGIDDPESAQWFDPGLPMLHAPRREQFLVVHGLDRAADKGSVTRLADAELHRD